MPENRKLSTILFADIEGYTALMQSDEAKALRFLNAFQTELEAKVPEFDGEIVQYFGDGCLLSFDSPSQALHCAMSLQANFKKLEIPVRAGMHLGEVIFTESNVFGDGVNVASRIESMGIAGGVLLSKSVRDQVKNKSEFQLVSLGPFEFKNIEEPLEVFAIANPGFAIPEKDSLSGKLKIPAAERGKRRLLPIAVILLAIIAGALWFLAVTNKSGISEENKERAVAVLPFENQTMDPSLDAFGMMTMDWISKALLESGEATLIRQDLRRNVDLTKPPKKAEILIRGRYYGNEELAIMAEAFDVKSGEVLFALGPLEGAKDDPMTLLFDLQQELLGFWNFQGTHLGERPPRYDAYLTFLKAWQIDSDPPHTEKVVMLKKAAQLDTRFSQPLLDLLQLSMWGFLPELRDSLMTVLEQRRPQLTEYEENRFESMKAYHAGNNLRKAELDWERYKKFNELNSGLGALTSYYHLNQMTTVIDLYQQEKNLAKNQHALARIVGAYFYLGEYEKAYELFNSYTEEPYLDWWGILNYLHLLAAMEKWEEFDDKLVYYIKQPQRFAFGAEFYPPMSLWFLAGELLNQGHEEKVQLCVELLEEYLKVDAPAYVSKDYYIGALHYLRGDFEKAYEYSLIYVQQWKYDWLTELPGVCLMKLGREQEAEEFMQYLKDRYNEVLPGQLEYALGAIEAQRNKALGVEYLKKSIEKGFEFDVNCFRHDPVLTVLMDYEPFLELIEPR